MHSSFFRNKLLARFMMMPSHLTSRSRVIILAAVCLAARLCAIFLVGSENLTFGDSPDYIAAAGQLCANASYPDGSSLPFFRAPGLPIFLAAFTFCHPDIVLLDKVLLVFLDAFSVLLIFLLTTRLWGSSRLGWVASSIACIYPPFLLQVTEIETEPLLMCSLLASAYFLFRSSRISYALAGIFLGYAALTRPVALVLIPAVITAVLLRRKEIRPALSLCIALGAASVLLPWTARNYLKFGELIIVNDAGGYNFWRGFHPEMISIYRAQTKDDFLAQQDHFETVTSPIAALEVHTEATSPKGRSQGWYERGMQNITGDPGRSIFFALKKAWIFWRPWLNPTVFSALVIGLSAAVFIPLYALGLWGLFCLYRSDKALALISTALIVLVWLAHIPYQVVTRFRVPFVDPAFIVFAAYPLHRFFISRLFYPRQEGTERSFKQ